MSKEITLAQAKRIAGRVGARIRAEDPDKVAGEWQKAYVVTITGRSFKDLDGEDRQTVFHAGTPLEAAHTAVIQTGAYCIALTELCKRVYVEEDALWQAGFHGGTSA